MKVSAKIFLSFLCLFVCSISVLGQTNNQKVILNKAIKNYAVRTIRVLNKNTQSFKYSLKNKNIFYNDIDSDGNFDAIVELFFCEIDSCHPTTNSSELVVFLNKKGALSFTASKGFSLFGKINSIEDGKIYIDVYSLDEEDPQCCPELKRSEVYLLEGNSLVKVRK